MSTVCNHCGAVLTQQLEKAFDGKFAVVWSNPQGIWICRETGNEHEPMDITRPESLDTAESSYVEEHGGG